MATGGDVLEYLRPDGGWVITGDDFDSIRYDEGTIPITRKEFEAGFSAADAAIQQRKIEKENKRLAAIAKLEALGLDEDDLKALGL